AMPHAPIGADLDEPLDVQRDLSPEVTLDLVAPVDELPEPVDLLLGEITDPRVGVDVRLGQDLLGRRKADPEDVGEGDFHPLLAGDVDAGDACHRLPLPLLVLGVGADDHHGAVATDDLAVVAARLDGGSDFQRILDSCLCVVCRARGGLLQPVGDAAAGAVVGYFSLEVLLPAERSLCESSTVTRAAGSIRMKFIRSLPLIWARTRWPF